VTAAVDRVQFGAWTGTLEAFRALHLQVVTAVKAGAVLGLVCCLLGWTTACSAENRATSPDTSPDGHGLLRQLLAEHGIKSHRRVRELDRVPDEVGTVIVLAPQSERARQVLVDWAREGGTVLFAYAASGNSSFGCAAPLELAPDAGFGSARVGGPRDATLTLEVGARAVIECGDRPYLTTQDFGEGRVLNLPDDQFLSNASLLVADNAWVLFTLLAEKEGEVELIDRFTGTAAATPLQAVARGKLTPLVAQLLLLLAVAALWRGVAFGTLRDPAALSRRSFAEHVRAVGQAYAKARATRLVLANYGGWALERLRERTQPGHGASLEALAQAVAARTGRSETDVRSVLDRVRIALDDPHPTATSWQDLATMRQLEALLSATGVSR
jgi:hypothetical protein